MKTIITILVSLFVINTSFGQDKKDKYQTVTIKTSAECGSCKTRIEEAMNYTKGVKFAELDVASKVLTVKYDVKKVKLWDLKQKIASVGYDADEVKAEKEALNKLPACCKPGGMKH